MRLPAGRSGQARLKENPRPGWEDPRPGWEDPRPAASQVGRGSG